MKIKCYNLEDVRQEQMADISAINSLVASVYVDELGYKLEHDDKGTLYGCFKGKEVIGSVLTKTGKQLGIYKELYGITEECERCSVSVRLVVKRGYRSTSVAFRLACATYVQQVRDGIEYSFVDSARDTVDFYLRLGYKVHRGDFLHPVYGDGVVLVLELQNLKYLESCKSLFAKALREIRGAGRTN